METISREELQKKLERNEDFALVEVLGAESYEDFHLPRAINVPLGKEFDEQIQRAVPEKKRPIVVYCKDEDCDASPRAARRMESLGYQHVFDYSAGKMDWKSAGLHVEHS